MIPRRTSYKFQQRVLRQVLRNPRQCMYDAEQQPQDEVSDQSLLHRNQGDGQAIVRQAELADGRSSQHWHRNYQF